MKILLVEQFCGGHYDNYLATLLPTLSRLTDDLTVAMPASVAKNSTVVAQALSSGTLHPKQIWPYLPEIPPYFSFEGRIQAAKGLANCLIKLRPDHTFLTSADPHAMGLFFSILGGNYLLKNQQNIDAIFHCGYPTSTATTGRNVIKRLIYEGVYRWSGFQELGFVSYLQYEDLVHRKVLLPERIRLVGDPVVQPKKIGKTAALELLGLQEGVFYLGLLGSLDKRKAIPELLQAYKDADLGSEYCMVLGGRIDSDYLRLIEASYSDLLRDRRLLLINRHLSELEMTHGYEALNLCTPLYYDFPGLSSLALKALACGCPLMVDNFGWGGALVREFGVGISTTLKSPEENVRAIRRAIDFARNPIPARALDCLMTFHSPDNFVALVLSNLYKRMGFKDTQPRIEWSSVREVVPAKV